MLLVTFQQVQLTERKCICLGAAETVARSNGVALCISRATHHDWVSPSVYTTCAGLHICITKSHNILTTQQLKA